MGEHSRGQGETMSHRLRELGSSSLYFPTGCIYVSASPYQLYMMGEGGCTFTTAQRIPPFHHHAHSTILLLVPLNVPRCYHSSVTASDEIKFNIYIYTCKFQSNSVRNVHFMPSIWSLETDFGFQIK